MSRVLRTPQFVQHANGAARAGAQKIDDATKRAEAIKPKLTAAQLEEVGKLLKSGATP